LAALRSTIQYYQVGSYRKLLKGLGRRLGRVPDANSLEETCVVMGNNSGVTVFSLEGIMRRRY